jgi:hypothetical protein
LLLAKIITTITLGVDRIQRLTIKSPLIAPNSHKNPAWHSQQSMPGSGKKAPWLLLFFLFSLSFFLPTSRKASINQNQTPGCTACGKPLYTTLHWQKQCHFSLPAGSKAACMKLQYEQVSIMHHEQLPQESNPVQPLSRLNTPQQKLKNINS